MATFKNLVFTVTTFCLIEKVYATNFMVSNNEGMRMGMASMESTNRNLATTSPTFPERQHQESPLPPVTENLQEDARTAIELMIEMIKIERLHALTYRYRYCL